MDEREGTTSDARPVAVQSNRPASPSPVTRQRTVVKHEVDRARGGVSLWSVVTGVAVALGAMLLMGALVGGIGVATGAFDQSSVTLGEAVDLGWGVGIGFVVAQFLSYLWGGYTAGRMARGAGFLNGLLVPVLALILAVGVAWIVSALGGTSTLALPPESARLGVNDNMLVNLGTALGIASIAAMVLGGVFGGMLGSHWHDKLERKNEPDEPEVRETA